MWIGFGPWRFDPGPCPVDDTPHTACTPESVGSLTVPVRPPGALAGTLAALAAPAAAAPLTFSTKTYRRATHGRPARAARARRNGDT